MKKLIITILLTIILATATFAATKPWAEWYLAQQEYEYQEWLISTEITGLNNAVLIVQTEEQKEELEERLSLLENRYKERLNTMDDLIIFIDEKDNLYAEGYKIVYFLGIWEQRKRMQFLITEEGDVARRFIGLGFLFTELPFIKLEEA